MEYAVNLFGYQTTGKLEVEDGKLIIRFDESEQTRLLHYLRRVLLRYSDLPDVQSLTLEQLIRKAIEVESGLSGRMAEPTVKLPYEVAPEVKEKLVQAAAMQNISATQLLIRLIETRYQQMEESVNG